MNHIFTNNNFSIIKTIISIVTFLALYLFLITNPEQIRAIFDCAKYNNHGFDCIGSSDEGCVWFPNDPDNPKPTEGACVYFPPVSEGPISCSTYDGAYAHCVAYISMGGQCEWREDTKKCVPSVCPEPTGTITCSSYNGESCKAHCLAYIGFGGNCAWDDSTKKCLDNVIADPPTFSESKFSDYATEFNQKMGNKFIPTLDTNNPGTVFADIINSLLPYLLTAAGLILFYTLIMGGFSMLTAAGDAKKFAAGQSKITMGIVGFLIIFAAYWIIQIIEVVLGISILN